MKTIKILNRDKALPLSWSNPFDVYASDIAYLVDGKIAYIDTGLEIDFPDDVDIKAEQIRDDLFVGCCVRNNRIFISASSFDKGGYFVIVRPGEKIARIRVVKQETESIRFIDFSEDKRMVVGDSKKAETENENE